MLRFDDIFIDCTKLGRKIPKEKYLQKGKYIIIDQGQNDIAGYSNEEDGIFSNVPVIIFGDHTRIFKLIKNPFFLGADGTKILKAKISNMSYDYLYYYLKYKKIPNTGYNRHFKWLKELTFEIKDFNEQKKISNVLDKISKILEMKKQQLSELDSLVKFQFLKIFGDPILNEKNWNMSSFGNNFKISSGGTPSTQKNEYWENGNISWIGSNMCQNKIIYKNDGKFITELGYRNSSAKIFKENTILVALVGATIGKTALLKFETATNQNVAGIEIINNDFIPEFVFYLLQKLYIKFQNLGSNNFKMANLTFIKELPLITPPIELQNKFADFVKQADKSKVELQKSIDETQLLFDSLMEKYFG